MACTTVIIDLLWFNAVHYSSLFQYTSVFFNYYAENSIFSVICFLLFWKQYYDYEYNNYSGTALLLLVNPHILYHIKTMALHSPVTMLYVNYCLKRLAMFNPIQSNYCLKITSAILWKLRTISVTNGSHHIPTYHKIDTFCSKQTWIGGPLYW